MSMAPRTAAKAGEEELAEGFLKHVISVRTLRGALAVTPHITKNFSFPLRTPEEADATARE